jgi:hypothetical protein
VTVVDLDQLFRPSTDGRPDAFSNAQVYEASVTRVDGRGVFVAIPSYDRLLEWGPCLPDGIRATVGEHVAVAMSNGGRPWLVSLSVKWQEDVIWRLDWIGDELAAIKQRIDALEAKAHEH